VQVRLLSVGFVATADTSVAPERMEMKPALPKAHFQEEVLQCVSIPVPLHLALRHGWMLKEKRNGSWHKRYFLLFRHTLVWYKTDKPDELAQGALTLADSNIVK
jgi:hypothetical protein